MLTFQYRLFASKSQISNFIKQLEVHRLLYNQCLEKKIESYKLTGKPLSGFELMKCEVPKLKGKSNSSSLQRTIVRLERAYSKFLSKQGGFPRFKDRFRTIKYVKIGDGCQFKNFNISAKLKLTFTDLFLATIKLKR